MGSKPARYPTRHDSAIDAGDPIPPLLIKAKSLCDALSSLSSDDGFNVFSELVESVPRLRNDIKTLEGNLAAREENHKSVIHDQLIIFENRYSEWKNEASVFQSNIDELRAAGQKRETEMAALQEKIGEYTAQIVDFEREHSEITKRLKERNQQVGDLEARLQNVQTRADDCSEKLKGSQKHAHTLEELLEKERAKTRSLVEEVDKRKNRLKELMEFSGKFNELNVSEV